MALVAVDLDKADLGRRRIQRMGDALVLRGGNSQSVVKEMTQKRAAFTAERLGQLAAMLPARSK